MMRVNGAAAIETDGALDEIVRRAIAYTGLDRGTDRRDALAAKIRSRLRQLDLQGFSDYLRLLDSERSAEWQALIDEITIGETFFFRYPGQWDALRDRVIPDAAARSGGRPLRVLCAGCANGAEPYTLSIMAATDLAPALGRRELSIVALDISASRIEQARAALYGAWDLRAIPPRYRECFEKAGSRWRLKEDFRRNVSFEGANLVRDGEALAAKWPAEFDIILCRNVMIYFAAETNRRLLQAFHHCLRDGGWFVAGHAEPYLEISNVFRPHPIDGMMFYRQSGAPRAATLAAAPEPPRVSAAPRPAPSTRRAVAPGAVRAAESGIAAARRLANAGEWREAKMLCESLAAADPLNPEIQFLIALICDHTGEGASVEQALKRAIYLDADFALAHYHLARAFAAKRDAPAAIRSLRNVFKCLGGAADGSPVACGDGLSAGELRKLADLQLGALEASV